MELNIYKLHSNPEQLYLYKECSEEIEVISFLNQLRDFKPVVNDEYIMNNIRPILRMYPKFRPLIERTILNLGLKGSSLILFYATTILRGRWKEGEPILRADQKKYPQDDIYGEYVWDMKNNCGEGDEWADKELLAQD